MIFKTLTIEFQKLKARNYMAVQVKCLTYLDHVFCSEEGGVI